MRLAVYLAAACAVACTPTPATPPRSPADASADASPTPGPDAPPPDEAPPNDAPAPVDATPARLRVLFLGNSYTYVNDLPGLVRAIAERSGMPPALDVETVAVGGATLRNHYEGPARMRLSERWDAVVLQGQSVEPLLNPTEFTAYGHSLASAARANGAFVYGYATWARRAGDPVYRQPWSGGSPGEMARGLESAYRAVVDPFAGVLVPVGARFEALRTEMPSVDLYDADGSHPSPAGTWVAACAFYRALTGRRAPASAAPQSVPAATAAALCP